VKVSRRIVLKGIGGAVLGLPLLESIGFRREARAQSEGDTFAIFFRQANGCAQESNSGEIGYEPERFYPTEYGPLTESTLAGRALDELTAFRDRLLVLRNVNMEEFPYGDGHARGAMQGLTGRGPTVAEAGGDSEASGESIDHRIGAALNADGRDSLFLYAGESGGWLGGPCISYRGPAQRRAAIHSPWEAYQAIVGGDGGLDPGTQAALAARTKSVNDLVRAQLQTIMGRSEISVRDRQRLQLHLDAVRDLEVALGCQLTEDEARALEGASVSYDSSDGDDTLAATRLHMQVAALAVACGWTRSVAIQIGSGNDGSTRYRNLESGGAMENFHYISHRRLSHDSSGDVIEGSDLLHHYVDRQFAQTFRHLLEQLDSFTIPSGRTLLDAGIAVWYNDNADGPPHGRMGVPWIIAGSAGGYLRQGECIELSNGSDEVNHTRLLNTLGTAVGVQNGSGGPLDDFGDPDLPKSLLTEIIA
jgi:hypothetical protein